MVNQINPFRPCQGAPCAFIAHMCSRDLDHFSGLGLKLPDPVYSRPLLSGTENNFPLCAIFGLFGRNRERVFECDIFDKVEP